MFSKARLSNSRSPSNAGVVRRVYHHPAVPRISLDPAILGNVAEQVRQREGLIFPVSGSPSLRVTSTKLATRPERRSISALDPAKWRARGFHPCAPVRLQNSFAPAGDRNSCETSCNRRRSAVRRVPIRPAMRSKVLASSPISSFRFEFNRTESSPRPNRSTPRARSRKGEAMLIASAQQTSATAANIRA